MRRFRGILVGVLCIAAVVGLIVLLGGGTEDYHLKYEGADLTADVSGIGRSDTYSGYLQAHNVETGSEPVEIDLFAYEGDAEVRTEDGGQVLFTPDSSSVTWKVTVPEDGM